MSFFNSVEFIANYQPQPINLDDVNVLTYRTKRTAVYIDGRVLVQWDRMSISDNIVWPYDGALTSIPEYLRRGRVGGVIPIQFINSLVDDYNIETLNYMNNRPNMFNGSKLIVVASPFGATLSTSDNSQLNITDIITCDQVYCSGIFATNPEIAQYGPTNIAWTQAAMKASGARVHVLEYNDSMLTQDQVFTKFSIKYITRGSLPLGRTPLDTSNPLGTMLPRLGVLKARGQRPSMNND